MTSGQTARSARRAQPRPIVVIGSINMDLVCRVRHIPRPGQTVLGTDVLTIPGGKGANQAVAAAKLGGTVHMVARVGDDDFGQRLLNGLRLHGVNTRQVTITEGVASGMATITVDAKGENAIVVTPGANHRLTPADIDAAERLIARAAVVVLQLEIPVKTVARAIAVCRRHGVRVILDPAPAPDRALPRALYGVDIFTPNQSEAQMLVGQTPTHGVICDKVPDPKQLGSRLLQRGARTVVLKLGSRGAMIIGRDGNIQSIRAKKVKVVDTTAAGDAFTGALATALAEGMGLSAAVRFANAAGALCCTNFGAQPALPDRAAVDAFL